MSKERTCRLPGNVRHADFQRYHVAALIASCATLQQGPGDARPPKSPVFERASVAVRIMFCMKSLLRITVFVLLLIGLGAVAYGPAMTYWKERNRVKWKTVAVVTGDIKSAVNSTGSIKPVLSVKVGSFVSGPIEKLHVDFNQEVMEGELLAEIDTRIYDAAVARDQAQLDTRIAEVKRAEAQLAQARRDEKRAMNLFAENSRFISQAEIDQVRFNREGLEALVAVAEAAVKVSIATLDNSKAQLAYTKIVSPVSGVVIDRKIDPGQTLAAQFQTPELFTVAPNIREKIHVFATVDEADIGLIREAQHKGNRVSFTVDAYPDDLFEGEIEQIRLSSTTTQNVVTYPVVVAAPNEDLKLLPGMTASISFNIDQREDILKIPNAALRFFPPEKNVREEDRKLLEGQAKDGDESASTSETTLAADERSDLRKRRNRRHVWIEDGDFLRAVEVVTGISDSRYTELIEGDLKPGQTLVTGIEPKKAFGT